MTPGRCLRLAAFAPPLLLIPPWAASFVRSFDASCVVGPRTGVYGALNGGRFDLTIHTKRRGFPPPVFRYGVYPPRRSDPFWECDLRFAGFGFGRSAYFGPTGRAGARRSILTFPPWFVPLALLAPAGVVVRRRLRSAAAGSHEAGRRRTYARRIRLGSPVLAAMLAVGLCEVADVSSARLPALDWAPAATVAVGSLLAAAGAAAGAILTALPVPRERRKAAAAGAALGFLGYWLALLGLSLLIVFGLLGLSVLLL